MPNVAVLSLTVQFNFNGHGLSWHWDTGGTDNVGAASAMGARVVREEGTGATEAGGTCTPCCAVGSFSRPTARQLRHVTGGLCVVQESPSLGSCRGRGLARCWLWCCLCLFVVLKKTEQASWVGAARDKAQKAAGCPPAARANWGHGEGEVGPGCPAPPPAGLRKREAVALG